MALGQVANTGITGSTARGSARIFSIVELRRSGASFEPTGIEFKWSADNFAAPRGAWQFGLQLRTMRRDLPGNEDPVEQVLGWNYTPFQVQGVWDDRHAGANYALTTWRDFEAMVKRGNLVRVQFEQVAITGLITQVQFAYRRRDQIGYTITVSPHQRFQGETVRLEVSPQRRVVVDPKTSVQRARAALEAVQVEHARARIENLSRVQQLLSTPVFSDVGEIIDDIDGFVTFAETTVDSQITQVENAATALNRGAQTMASVKTSAATLLARLQSAASTSEMAVDTVIETLQFEQWLRGLAATSRQLIVQAKQSEDDFALRAQPKPKRMHRCRQGESLYAISTRYYGTPHHWRQILSLNQLSSLILEGGELLVIPEIA
jgi:nucleoid-associated protein YgaU